MEEQHLPPTIVHEKRLRARPSVENEDRIGVDEALERVASRALPQAPDAPDRLAVGVEPERFAVEHDSDGCPVRRLPLLGTGGVLDSIDAHRDSASFEPRDPERVPPLVALRGGGSLTFEPGAQIEHSTAVHDGASAALDDVQRIADELEGVFGDRRVALVSLGIDPWSTPEDVPQQLDAPRYRAMASYFDRVADSGPWMMRLSCSLQVNVDLGTGRTREERWLLANLLSPALVASFSTSPELDGEAHFHCRRARVWQTIDPTRTGFPRGLLANDGRDPGEQYADLVLDADVMLFRTAEGAVAGRPGFSFREWIQNGHPEHGFPTAADLEYHLTTVFPEVRARGFLELRAIDALPTCWQPAAVAFVCGLLYDDQARGAALERLAGGRAELHQRWWDAAEHGYDVAGLRDESDFLWRTALEGAERLGVDFLRANHLAEARAFAERFPLRGRAPADELRESRSGDPCAALRWAVGSACEAFARP